MFLKLNLLAASLIAMTALASHAEDESPRHGDPTTPGWSSWNTIGGVGTSDPAACSRSGFQTEVFVRGTDNALRSEEHTSELQSH